MDGELFSHPTLAQQSFFLGFKGYLQLSCLGPLARVAESSQPATGVSAADKQKKDRRRGEGWGRGWQGDMYVHRGPRLTFVQNIEHRWNCPGMKTKRSVPHG